MPRKVSRRSFIMASGAARWALAETSRVQPGAARAVLRPNILFIMTDQQRYDALGANGNRLIRTPNLDRLAAKSANFTHAFVQAPVCVPSRACFFTGRYAHAHRNRVNYTPLSSGETLMPRRLQDAGYRTALVGKLHLYYRYPPTNAEAGRMGFHHVELHDGVPFTDEWSDYAKWREQQDPMRDVHYRRLARSVPGLRSSLSPETNPNRSAIAEQYSDTTWTGMRTRHYLKELAAGGKPFFLFSSFWKPHSPFEVPSPFDAIYNETQIPLPGRMSLADMQKLPVPVQKLALRWGGKYQIEPQALMWDLRSYYASVTHIDREVGLILDTLEETGQADNTIVVFSSDHGDQLLEHGITGKNVFYEASVHVPLMISYPKMIKAARYDQLIQTIDLMPSLLEMTGLEAPDNCHGRSLVPLIDGSGRPYAANEAVFCENVIPEVITSASDEFMYVRGKGVNGVRHPDAKMVRTQRWKLCHYPQYGGELFDLANDPLEQTNLYGQPQFKTLQDELQERILNWLITATETEQIAPRWLIG